MTLTLGRAILLIREQAGETQAAFARALGITQVHVSNLENDKGLPSVPLLAQVRDLYGFCPMLLVALAALERGETDRGLETITAHRALLGLSVS